MKMIAALFANRTKSRSRFQMAAKPLAFAAILVVLALSIGGAVGQRMEQRAAQDRFSFGEVADNCTRCAPASVN
jgi:hypothetical protein